jgi:hypothetical protein
MQSYRLLLLDKHGRLLESIVVNGHEDGDAMAAAEDEVRRCEYVEVWKGGRPLGICARPSPPLSHLQRLFRPWRMRRTDLDPSPKCGRPGYGRETPNAASTPSSTSDVKDKKDGSIQ